VDSGILSSGIGARVLWDARITFKTKQSDFIFLPRSFPDGGSKDPIEPEKIAALHKVLVQAMIH
jgi:hypothetical protein